MTKITENNSGRFEKNRRRHKRRKSALLPGNFDSLTNTQKIEVLRGVVIVQARLIEHLLGDE